MSWLRALLLGAALSSCAQSELEQDARVSGARNLARADTPTGIIGAAASAESHATRVAMQILRDGGNAIDAAIALHFALAVTYPNAGNIGGGGFLMFRNPEGEAWFMDFREVAPAASSADMYLDLDGNLDRSASTVGWKAAGVPGSVVGMWEAHQRWGSISWASLVWPAAYLAENGFPINAGEARGLNRYRRAFADDARASKVFIRADGEEWQAGDTLVQQELAETLKAIARGGAKALREGPIVDQLVAESAAHGGILSGEDFSNYQAVIRPCHRIDWQGLEIFAATPPSSGGVFLDQVLTSLEGAPLPAWGYRDARSVQLIGEAEAAAFRDRNRWMGDPETMQVDYVELLDRDYLGRRRMALQPDVYTPPDASLPLPPFESEETTHLSVLDGNGGAVSITTTLNGAYGAKVMAPGGFLMNNEMDDFAALPGRANQYGLVQSEANAIHAGRRPLSSMSPIIVVRNNQVDAVIGSPGGPTILTTVLQVLLHRYVFHMSPEEAVAAPRFHRQDRPPTLRYEAGRLGRPVLQQLQAWGQPVAETNSLGDVNAIFRDGREWSAVADPRRGGLALIDTGSPR